MGKLTAGNCKFLAEVKRLFNSKIYAKALEIANKQGIDSARAYVQTFSTSPLGF